MKTEPVELLNGAFRPITDTTGFFECDAKAAADAFYAWRDRTYSRDGRQLQITRVEAESLPKVLSTLLPLTSRTCRWLFVETKSDWCAFFSNWWRGTDSTAIAPLGGVRLSCRSIRCTNVPYGESLGAIFEVYRPSWGEYGNTERTISALKDGSNWAFDVIGEPFGFEQVERYQDRRIRDRFTPEMLDQYLKHFGIAAFDESFYRNPNCTGYLVSIAGPKLPNSKEYDLKDVCIPA